MQATITGTAPTPASVLSALSALDGSKTYLSIGLGVAYVLYCQYISHTAVDPTIMTAIGGMILAAFRSAMKTNNAKVVDAVAVGPTPTGVPQPDPHPPKAEPVPPVPLTPEELQVFIELAARLPKSP